MLTFSSIYKAMMRQTFLVKNEVEFLEAFKRDSDKWTADDMQKLRQMHNKLKHLTKQEYLHAIITMLNNDTLPHNVSSSCRKKILRWTKEKRVDWYN